MKTVLLTALLCVAPAALIRHRGGDVYGEISLQKLGSVAYTGFALGSYYSRLVPVWAGSHDDPANRLYDKVVTARVDLNTHWNVKVESHFMDGYGNPQMYPDGFHTAVNPQGLKPRADFLMLRTGWNF
ncbi:MAG: hypothetical protein ACLQVN_08165 [Bryobacteraceae bacterium]